MNISKAYQFWPKRLFFCIILSALSMVSSQAMGAGIGQLTRKDALRNAVKVAQIATSVGAAIIVGNKVFNAYNSVPRETRLRNYNEQLAQHRKEYIEELDPSLPTQVINLGSQLLEASYRSKLSEEQREKRDKEQREQEQTRRNERDAQFTKASLRIHLADERPDLFDRKEFWEDASMGLLGGAAGGGATYLIWELCASYFGIA